MHETIDFLNNTPAWWIAAAAFACHFTLLVIPKLRWKKSFFFPLTRDTYTRVFDPIGIMGSLEGPLVAAATLPLPLVIDTCILPVSIIFGVRLKPSVSKRLSVEIDTRQMACKDLDAGLNTIGESRKRERNELLGKIGDLEALLAPPQEQQYSPSRQAKKFRDRMREQQVQAQSGYEEACKHQHEMRAREDAT